MGIFDMFKKRDAETIARQAARAERVADIQRSLQNGDVPAAIRTRLEGARRGRLPWTATLTPAELMITRSHGLKPIAAVSATCWLHYGWPWTEGHAEGRNTAVRRVEGEARGAGPHAVLDVQRRTIPLSRRPTTAS